MAASNTLTPTEASAEAKALAIETSTKIKALLDFDGTFSGRAGGETVYSDLYGNVQNRTVEEKDGNGRTVIDPRTKKPFMEYVDGATFIEKEEMLRRMRAGFLLKENQDMQLAPGAKNTLLALLAANAEIDFITKNHAQWIQAILEIEGFTSEQINQIAIHDIKAGGGDKFSTAKNILAKTNPESHPNTTVLICDDSERDFKEMKRAAMRAAPRATLIAENAVSGQFNFAAILAKIPKTAPVATPVAATSTAAKPNTANFWTRVMNSFGSSSSRSDPDNVSRPTTSSSRR